MEGCVALRQRIRRLKRQDSFSGRSPGPRVLMFIPWAGFGSSSPEALPVPSLRRARPPWPRSHVPKRARRPIPPRGAGRRFRGPGQHWTPASASTKSHSRGATLHAQGRRARNSRLRRLRLDAQETRCQGVAVMPPGPRRSCDTAGPASTRIASAASPALCSVGASRASVAPRPGMTAAVGAGRRSLPAFGPVEAANVVRQRVNETICEP
jgi:hypothetical protein